MILHTSLRTRLHAIGLYRFHSAKYPETIGCDAPDLLQSSQILHNAFVHFLLQTSKISLSEGGHGASVTLRLGVHERELFNREGASDAATAGGISAERILSLAKVNSPAGAKAHQFTTEREHALSG